VQPGKINPWGDDESIHSKRTIDAGIQAKSTAVIYTVCSALPCTLNKLQLVQAPVAAGGE
jgi:hypothetical protein